MAFNVSCRSNSLSIAEADAIYDVNSLAGLARLLFFVIFGALLTVVCGAIFTASIWTAAMRRDYRIITAWVVERIAVSRKCLRLLLTKPHTHFRVYLVGTGSGVSLFAVFVRRLVQQLWTGEPLEPVESATCIFSVGSLNFPRHIQNIHGWRPDTYKGK